MKLIKLAHLWILGYDIERGCGAPTLTFEPWVNRNGNYYRIFVFGTSRYTIEIKRLLKEHRPRL